MIDIKTSSTSFVWKLLELYGTKFNHPAKWRIHQYLRSTLLHPCDCNLEVERQGLRWVLNPADFVQTHLYWTNEYEPWDLLQISKWAHPGAIVLDVGANFGYYSLKLGAAVQPGDRVFAFEPSPETFTRLKCNIALNRLDSTVTPVQCALSDNTGFSYLSCPEGNSGAAALSDVRGEPVELDTLDHFCDRHAINDLSVIKIDVEGNELRVIRGGITSIKRYLPIIMIEFNSSALEKAGTSVFELSDLLHSVGYELFRTKRRRLVHFENACTSPMVVNVFCIPHTESAR